MVDVLVFSGEKAGKKKAQKGEKVTTGNPASLCCAGAACAKVDQACHTAHVMCTAHGAHAQHTVHMHSTRCTCTWIPLCEYSTQTHAPQPCSTCAAAHPLQLRRVAGELEAAVPPGLQHVSRGLQAALRGLPEAVGAHGERRAGGREHSERRAAGQVQRLVVLCDDALFVVQAAPFSLLSMSKGLSPMSEVPPHDVHMSHDVH